MSAKWTAERAARAAERRRRQLAEGPSCTVAECSRTGRVKGVCEMHYLRMQRRGTYDPPRRPTILERFWAKVSEAGPDDCWEWKGSRHSFGYGFFTIEDRPNVRVTAHRFALILATGEELTGKVVRHACDNPPCCNPAHLIAGTQAENVADMHARGRADLSGLAIGQRMPKRRATS